MSAYTYKLFQQLYAHISLLAAFLLLLHTISHLSSSKCYFTLNLAQAGSAGCSIGSFPVMPGSDWSRAGLLTSDWLRGSGGTGTERWGSDAGSRHPNMDLQPCEGSHVWGKNQPHF